MSDAPPLTRRPKVLVFCRPYLIPDFRTMTEPLASRFEFGFLTDGKCPGTQDTRAIFYANLKARNRSAEIDAELQEDVRIRCRMLRKLEPELARDLLHAMAIALAAHLNREKPDTVFSQLTDEYVTHLLAVLAAKRGLNTVQTCYAYFQNRMQFFDFAYGVAREGLSLPDRREAAAVLTQLQKIEHRQDYHLKASYSFMRHVQLVLRYYIKRIAFWFFALMQQDPWYVHYAIVPYVAERRRISDYPKLNLFRSNWESALDAARAEGKLIIYLPLGYHPESSTDYWIADRRYVNYIETVMGILAFFSGRDDVCIAVKEHVHMLGMRGNDVYEALSKCVNVVSITPTAFSNQVLQRSDCVLIGTGSVGIEAMVHDTPVFSFCNTSYWFEPSGAYYLDLDDLAGWPDQIRAIVRQHRLKSEIQKIDALCMMMTGTAPNIRMGSVWPIAEPTVIGAALTEALSQAPRQGLMHAANSSSPCDPEPGRSTMIRSTTGGDCVEKIL